MSDITRTIGELMRERGNIAARRAAGGQIWGNAIQNIGATVASIPAQIQQKRALEQHAAMQQQEMTMRGQEIAQRQQQMQMGQAALAAQQQADAIIAKLPRNDDGTYDTGDFIKQLAGVQAPTAVIDHVAKTIESVNTSMAALNKSRDEHLADAADSALALKPKDGPLTADTVHIWIAAAKGTPLLSKADADALTQALAGGAEPEAALKQLRRRGTRFRDIDKPIVKSRTSDLVNAAGDVLVAGAAPTPPAETRATLAVKAANPDPAISEPAKKALDAMKADTPIHVGSFEDYVARYAAAKNKTAETLTPTDIEDARKRYQQADDRPRITVQTGGTQEDAEAIADAIIRGEQPPEMTGLYRMGGPVRGALAKKGYNQAAALTDWRATQKHVATLNGAQQTRMAQAIDNAAHSLDVIDTLADQWNAGRFPILNRLTLKAAKGGALGKDAQQLATQLEAQISDVTSELGNVYMGGNSPTDHALTLAAKNLSADWNKDQLKSALALARQNLTIRANSMKNVGVAGASATNPYAAPAAAPTVKPTMRYNPATGKVEPIK